MTTSVADEIAFAALPADVQSLARRVLMEVEGNMYNAGFGAGVLAGEAIESRAAAVVTAEQHETTEARAASAERSPVVGQCCIDAYVLGWDECNDEYQAQRVPSNHDVAARIAESRDDDGDAR